MKTYIKFLLIILVGTSCSDFLELEPEHQISEGSFYQNANDFRTALIGSYGGLQNLHNTALVYVGELPTDNAEVRWTSPTISEVELEEVDFTPANGFLNTIWGISFTTISRSNNILSRLDDADITDQLRNQFRGEALFLRAYCYFQLARIFGPVPLVEVAFRSPGEIDAFDMTRRPVDEVYSLIISDLNQAATLLENINDLGKSRASTGAAKTLLGKVYLTQNDYQSAENVLKEVIDNGS
jgi:starch-binding outer membrane protein, SusD/RagB family